MIAFSNTSGFNMNTTVSSSRHKQTGATTLVMSIILLVSVSMTTLFTARSSVMELKINANELRTQQAFEAAEAGLNHGIAYVLSAGADQDSDGSIDTLADHTFSTGNGSSYSVALSDISATSNFSKIRVTATGRSDDSTGTRVLTQDVQVVQTLALYPNSALTGLGSVHIQGSANAITNEETEHTVWSGGNVTFGGAGSTYSTAGGCSALPCADVNDGSTTGDAALAALNRDQFFSNFFGKSKAEVRADADVEVAADLSDPLTTYSFSNVSGSVAGLTNKLIWINGSAQINGNTQIGTADDPVIVIIDGNAKFGGNSTIYGLVYITNDWKHGNGVFNIRGAAIVEGNYESSGNPNTEFDSTVLAETNSIGTLATLAGSWKDF